MLNFKKLIILVHPFYLLLINDDRFNFEYVGKHTNIGMYLNYHVRKYVDHKETTTTKLTFIYKY